MSDEEGEMQEAPEYGDILTQLSEEQIPAAFQQLTQSSDTIKQIVTFCTNSYSPSATSADISDEKTATAFAQTRKYTSNALLNVAYHVQNIATLLGTYVDGQLDEIDRMLVDTQAVADRLRSYYDRTGSDFFRTEESTRYYEKQGKCTKLTGDDLPDLAQPLPKFERGGGEGEKGF